MRCGSLIVHALTDLIRMRCWLLQVEFSNSHQYSWLRLKSEVTQQKCQGSPGLHLDCDVLSTKLTTWTSSQVSNATTKGESTSPVSTRLAWFCFFLHASTYLCTAAPDHHQKWKDNKNILHRGMKDSFTCCMCHTPYLVRLHILLFPVTHTIPQPSQDY